MSRNNVICEWLDGEGWNLPLGFDEDNALKLFAQVFKDNGFSPRRIGFAAQILHPLYMAKSILWDGATNTVIHEQVPHAPVEVHTDFLNTPVHTILADNAYAVRRNYVGTGSCLGPKPAHMDDDKTTDYIAIRIPFRHAAHQVAVFCMTTDAPNGFTNDQLCQIDEAIPTLSRVVELHIFSEFSQTLLETYLGKTPGQMVMDGSIRRGDGIDTRAVIWFCDLRHSTRLSAELPRQEYLTLLNEYFDCVARVVLENGGEILRYIGDAALAIFPITEAMNDKDACDQAYTAAETAQMRMSALNKQRKSENKPPISFGLGLHIGEVTYGNVGIQTRLEFTVIGEAANRAARLQDQTKIFDCTVIASESFRQAHAGSWRYLGEMDTQIQDTTISVYTPKTVDDLF